MVPELLDCGLIELAFFKPIRDRLPRVSSYCKTEGDFLAEPGFPPKELLVGVEEPGFGAYLLAIAFCISFGAIIMTSC